MQRLRRFGPGLLVTAAFVGPGTVTTASKAGAGFGFALLWALVFATVATIVLQEMAARLGLVGRRGLGEAVRASFPSAPARWAACGLVIAAIALGNAAYQTGNVTGAAIGLETVLGWPTTFWALVVSGLSALLLASGVYRYIEMALVALVAAMSVVFVLTMFAARPDWGAMLASSLIPSLPEGSLLTVIGLIGTTVVPYNLFLHSDSVQQKWPADVPVEPALRASRIDTTAAVVLGGVVTLAITSTSASVLLGKDIRSAGDMAGQLQPTLGSAAQWFFALGLFAAGMTSAITAPLAAAYATAGVLGWPRDLKSWRFRSVWMAVLAAGALAACLLGHSPTNTILVAQVANGMVLPFVAVLLLVAVNRAAWMGRYRNGWLANLAGFVVVATAAGLGLSQIIRQF